MAITFLFCVFLGRFLYIQLLWEDDLNYLALDQWTREIPVNAGRGMIVDRNGEVLAGNRAKYAIYARANAVTDAEGASRILADLLGESYETILKKLSDKSRSEIVIARKTEKAVVESLAEREVKGVYFARSDDRVYPYGSLASQVIGFTAFDRSGTSGVEGYYDPYLAGKNGEILFDTDLVGAEVEGETVYLPATDGLNVKLTLDYRIQALCEDVMKLAYEQTSAKAARAIVLDPRDFSVLAMVNLPSYDLNDIPRDDLDRLNALSRNRLVSDVYEPGSTFKIVTAAADIEEFLRGNSRALDPNTYVFSSSRTRIVDGTTIRCWSDHKNGKHAGETLAEALNNSCNPCFVDIALALGKETFYDYLSAFRFGRATGIDFSGESIGMLLPESTLRDCDFARIGFGQSVAVTPLQLACAAASAVNGGYYYAPRLVQEILSSDGSVKQQNDAVLLGRTVSEEASRILSGMLEGVVRDGSGKKAYLEGYRVAGKTGTAQKYENGAIASGKYVSSFLGFFPADDPEYLALVILDEPQGSYYGSTVAAPCAKEIFQGIIDLMNIPPKEVKP